MKQNYGKLYIVPTPIGNLGDMTYRAVEVLKNCSVIAAEDTRTSKRLMQEYCINTHLFSYHKHNEQGRGKQIIEKLQNGEDVAVITDAGTPGISDPAKIVIQAAIKNNIIVETLPGATAFVPAIVSSGLDNEHFAFMGFLPDKQNKRYQLLDELKPQMFPTIFYESPHRIHKFLELIYDAWGERKIVIAREISKLYETYYRGKISKFVSDPDLIKAKGEFVVIVDGAQKESWDDEKLKELLLDLIKGGESKKLAVKKISNETGENKNRIYEIALNLTD